MRAKSVADRLCGSRTGFKLVLTFYVAKKKYYCLQIIVYVLEEL